MTHSSNARANIIAFLAILALSALTMVWLFWHHPVKTLIATIAVLAALGISARLARGRSRRMPLPIWSTANRSI